MGRKTPRPAPKKIACDCGVQMSIRQSTRHKYPAGGYKYYYCCSAFPGCGTTISAHPDGTPMGVPSVAATRRARVDAHKAFDGFWPRHGLTRNEAYKLLCDLMGLPGGVAHIGHFTADQCTKLIEVVDRLEVDDEYRRVALAGELAPATYDQKVATVVRDVFQAVIVRRSDGR